MNTEKILDLASILAIFTGLILVQGMIDTVKQENGCEKYWKQYKNVDSENVTFQSNASLENRLPSHEYKETNINNKSFDLESYPER